MRRGTIKIIKRDAAPALPPSPSPEELLIQQQKDDAVEERGMKDIVKTWITERRENNRTEVAEANRRFDS